MVKDKCVIKSITIRSSQSDFLEDEDFVLSRFVQMKLDEYIKFRKESIQFSKEVNEL